MRKIIRSFAVAAALLFAMQAKAVIFDNAILGPIRSEITNQMVINSNTVPFNKPLATALRSALTTIDRPGKTNIAGDVKILSSLQTALKKTVLSNLFNAQIDAALDQYIAIITAATEGSSNRLNATLPSGPRTAAGNNLAQVISNLNNSRTLADLAAAIRALSTAITKLGVTDGLIAKAELVKPGPNSLTAKVTATGEGTFTYKPIPFSVQAVYSPVTKILNVTSTYIKPGLTTLTRSVGFVLGNLEPGTHTYNVSSLSVCYYQSSTVKVGVGVIAGDVYEDNAGSITVTLNPSQKVVSGTFNFSGNGSNRPQNTANVEGSFTINYLQ